jgi:hypothetical protein
MNMPDGASLGDLGLPLRGTLQNLPASGGYLSFPLGWLCGVLPSLLGWLTFLIESCLIQASVASCAGL